MGVWISSAIYPEGAVDVAPYQEDTTFEWASCVAEAAAITAAAIVPGRTLVEGVGYWVLRDHNGEEIAVYVAEQTFGEVVIGLFDEAEIDE